MRQTISGLVAAVAVMAVSAPALACGYGTGCGGYVAPSYVSGCNTGCGAYVPPPVVPTCNTGCGWAYQHLPEPTHQYYYVNQGPYYSGPGNFAPVPTYQESVVPGADVYAYPRRRYVRHLRHAAYRMHPPVLRRYY
jgi:hypothetical protein